MKKFYYRVQKDDSVLSISNKFNLCVFTIIENNNLKGEIEAGDILYIQSQSDSLYTVKPCDTIYSICKKFNKKEEELLQENNVDYIFCGLKIKI